MRVRVQFEMEASPEEMAVLQQVMAPPPIQYQQPVHQPVYQQPVHQPVQQLDYWQQQPESLGFWRTLKYAVWIVVISSAIFWTAHAMTG